MGSISLPEGILPNPLPFSPDAALTGGEVLGFRFDLLDSNDLKVGTLDGVEGGHVEWSSFTAIKGSGSLDVQDTGQVIDWLNVRVRPMALISDLVNPQRTECGLGVYICAAPTESWEGSQRSWSVELLDKLSILDQDIVTDEYGDPLTYVAPIGANIVELVVNLIQGVGELTPAIEAAAPQLSSSMVWEVGTSVLKIVNELLEAGGFSSFFVTSAAGAAL